MIALSCADDRYESTGDNPAYYLEILYDFCFALHFCFTSHIVTFDSMKKKRETNDSSCENKAVICKLVPLEGIKISKIDKSTTYLSSAINLDEPNELSR